MLMIVDGGDGGRSERDVAFMSANHALKLGSERDAASASVVVLSETKLRNMSAVAAETLLDSLGAAKEVVLVHPAYRASSLSDAKLRTLVQLCCKYQQWHLFADDSGWSKLDEADKSAFLAEVLQRKAMEHIERFRRVMGNKLETSEIEPAPSTSVIDFPFCSTEYCHYEQIGKSTLMQNKVGFVLVAGGLGERLGSTQIKISLPTESLTHKSFLELFLQHISSYADPPPPLCIMTSDDTYQGTIEHIKSLPNSAIDITLCKQETVVCFLDREGRLALKSPGKLLLKPHGHGDVHQLVHDSVLKPWRSRGIEYIVFFQDTNPNCFRVLPSVLGVVHKQSLDCAMACVPRIPKSATGCIARNRATNTLENFEYNLMNIFLAENPHLDESFTLGNTNQMVVRADAYSKVSPFVPEFCNPKFQQGSDSVFSSPARLECLMQDVMKFFSIGRTRAVLFHDMPENKTKTHVLYAPAKNSLKVAQRAWDANTTDGSPASSEAAVYAGNCAMLTSLGCTVKLDNAHPVHFGGPQSTMCILPLYPCVVFDPRSLPFWSEAKAVFRTPRDVYVGGNSSLELRGPGKFIIRKLHLEGSLVLWAKSPTALIQVDCLTVRNSGRTVGVVEGDARLTVTHGKDFQVFESEGTLQVNGEY